MNQRMHNKDSKESIKRLSYSNDVEIFIRKKECTLIILNKLVVNRTKIIVI